MAGCADDVAAVLDHLGVDEAAVVGWSAGGRVAAGVAARHPDRVTALALVATPSPADDSWIPPEHQAMLEPLREDPASATAGLAQILGQFLTEADVALASNVGDADEAVLADPDVRARVLAMHAEGLRHGPHGVAADIVADQIAGVGLRPGLDRRPRPTSSTATTTSSPPATASGGSRPWSTPPCTGPPAWATCWP